MHEYAEAKELPPVESKALRRLVVMVSLLEARGRGAVVYAANPELEDILDRLPMDPGQRLASITAAIERVVECRWDLGEDVVLRGREQVEHDCLGIGAQRRDLTNPFRRV
jgi:hypothetical protein